MWRIYMQPLDYLSSFGVTFLSSPVAKSKTNPRIATFTGERLRAASLAWIEVTIVLVRYRPADSY
jgi:hypothetical protein